VLRVLGLSLAAAALLAGSAHADGVPSAYPSPGVVVTSADGRTHYTTVWIKRISILIATDARTGAVNGYQVLGGGFGVTQVAFDGATVGLAGDRTLVLAEYPAGRKPSTRLALVDTRTLQARAVLRLAGSFTLDAISPDGRTLFLIQALGRNQAHYVVRAYDLMRRRLVPSVIADRREPDEQMQGRPLARATSEDGRWAYTLYAKPSGETFVHALDTERRTAWCIDLETTYAFGQSQEPTLALSADGDELRIVDAQGGTAELVDTRTFEARLPSAHHTPASWIVAAVAAALAAAVAR